MATLTLKPLKPSTRSAAGSKPQRATSGARARVQAQARMNNPAPVQADYAPARPANRTENRSESRPNTRSDFAPNTHQNTAGNATYSDYVPSQFAQNAQRRVDQKQQKFERTQHSATQRETSSSGRELNADGSHPRPRNASAPRPNSGAGFNPNARTAQNIKPWQNRGQADFTPSPAPQYPTQSNNTQNNSQNYTQNYTPPAPRAVAQDDIHAPQDFFASCPRGLEWALVGELERLGITVTQRIASGAHITATWQQIARANVHSRIASRFLWRLSSQTVRGEDDIYAQASRVPWEKFFNWRDTIKVDTVGIRAEVRSLEFVTLRVKDAICDRFRAIDGNRPSVDTVAPQMRIMCVLDGLYSQLYLDTSGEPLFKRGWRAGMDAKGEAALKENLAAGLLALTEWDGAVPLYDPMCGSGTLIIEAAQRACGVPPGSIRAENKGFALQRFWHVRLPKSDYEPLPNNKATAPQLFASDISPEMVSIAAGNVLAAGLAGDAVQIGQLDVLEITPPTEQPGLLVLNPPYGERMNFANELDADTFYEAFAANLKRNFKGWTVWLLTSDEQVQARMRLKPNASHHVFNGALACRWLKFEIT